MAFSFSMLFVHTAFSLYLLQEIFQDFLEVLVLGLADLKAYSKFIFIN